MNFQIQQILQVTQNKFNPMRPITTNLAKFYIKQIPFTKLVFVSTNSVSRHKESISTEGSAINFYISNKLSIKLEYKFATYLNVAFQENRSKHTIKRYDNNFLAYTHKGRLSLHRYMRNVIFQKKTNNRLNRLILEIRVSNKQLKG